MASTKHHAAPPRTGYKPTPANRRPAALAASLRVKEESDAIRARAGLEPVPLGASAQGWADQLGVEVAS